MTDETDTDSDDEAQAQSSILSRRGMLAALAGVGAGGAAAAGISQTGAAASGALGASGDALQAAYLAELRGPILDQGTPIDQLVNIRVAEVGATVNADPGTLIIRYNP
jgi:hypothetical protein